MILGIGIDAVEIARFAHWHTKPINSLRRIFSDTEITYCLLDIKHSAERFAARFAAREAVYKVIHAVPALQHIPFLTLARAITIVKNASGAPMLQINWQQLTVNQSLQIFWHLSLTHTKDIAIASVIAEQKL